MCNLPGASHGQARCTLWSPRVRAQLLSRVHSKLASVHDLIRRQHIGPSQLPSLSCHVVRRCAVSSLPAQWACQGCCHVRLQGQAGVCSFQEKFFVDETFFYLIYLGRSSASTLISAKERVPLGHLASTHTFIGTDRENKCACASTSARARRCA